MREHEGTWSQRVARALDRALRDAAAPRAQAVGGWLPPVEAPDRSPGPDGDVWRFPALSPAGRWLAYHPDETGRNAVFVRPFPDTDAVRRQGSVAGGTSPLWSRDGRELFFLGPEREMMAARMATTGTPDTPISFARPVALFRVPDELLGYEYAFYTPWDVAPDGRFLMARVVAGDEAEPARFVIAEHWDTELRERLTRASR